MARAGFKAKELQLHSVVQLRTFQEVASLQHDEGISLSASPYWQRWKRHSSFSLQLLFGPERGKGPRHVAVCCWLLIFPFHIHLFLAALETWVSTPANTIRKSGEPAIS